MDPRIKAVKKQKANRRCFDCRSRGPGYICLNYTTFICSDCAGIHRESNRRVKSIALSTFDENEINALERGGNEVAWAIWMGSWGGKKAPSFKDDDDGAKLRSHMQRKYVEKRWYVVPDVNSNNSEVNMMGGSVRNLFSLQLDEENKGDNNGSQDAKDLADVNDILNLFSNTTCLPSDGVESSNRTKSGTSTATEPIKKKGRRPRKKALAEGKGEENTRARRRKKVSDDGETLEKTLSFLDSMLAFWWYIWVELFKAPSRLSEMCRGLATSDRKYFILAHVIFGLLSILMFLGRTYSSWYYGVFLPCIVLEALHFWTVKNVSGPKLVALHWGFNQAKKQDSDSGSINNNNGNNNRSSNVNGARKKVGKRVVSVSGSNSSSSSTLNKPSDIALLFTGTHVFSYSHSISNPPHQSVSMAFWLFLTLHTVIWGVLFASECIAVAYSSSGINGTDRKVPNVADRGNQQWVWLWLASFSLMLSVINYASYARAHREVIKSLEERYEDEEQAIEVSMH